MLRLSSTDRLDILELLANADSAATRRDTNAYIALFTDDAILEGSKGNHKGKDAVRRSLLPIWQSEGPITAHLTLNAVISPIEGRPDEATVMSTLVILNIGPTISVHSVSNIIQHVVKQRDTWLIKRRSVLDFGAKSNM